MGAPLYGYQPRSVTPDEVFADCVEDYPMSESRSYIWSGIKDIIARTCALHPVPAPLHIDSEFVEATRDPSHAALFLEAQAPCPRELVLLWKAENKPQWMVETYLLPRPPAADSPLRSAWEIARDELLADLSAAGAKGYAITELHACHAYTKS